MTKKELFRGRGGILKLRMVATRPGVLGLHAGVTGCLSITNAVMALVGEITIWRRIDLKYCQSVVNIFKQFRTKQFILRELSATFNS